MTSQSSILGRQTLSPTKTPQPIVDTCDSPEAALWGIRSVPVVLVATPSLVGPLELEAGLCLAGMGALVELAPGIGCCAGCQHLLRIFCEDLRLQASYCSGQAEAEMLYLQLGLHVGCRQLHRVYGFRGKGFLR